MTSSVSSKKSRYVSGGVSEVRGNTIEWWERGEFGHDSSDFFYYISKQHAHRPDLIAHHYYNDSRLWWVIMQYNSILDPYAETEEGSILRLPTATRMAAMLTGKVGGVQSTRVLYHNTVLPIV